MVLFVLLCLLVTVISASSVFYLINTNKFKNITLPFSKEKEVIVEKPKVETPVEQKIVLEDTSKDFDLNITRVNIKNTLFDLEECTNLLSKKGINIDFITIHKLLKYKTDFDEDGSLIFVKNEMGSLIRNYDIVIIDECSMIGIQILEQIYLL